MTTKAPQVAKAAKTAKAAKKGVQRRKYKVRTSLRFYKPNTLRLASKPKYERTRAGLKLPAKFNKYSVLVQPLNT
jgi:large subunit ribosomal protein L23Ae